MMLSSLLNDKIRKELNLVFVLVSNCDGDYLDIDKFYVNEEEYTSFAENIDNHISRPENIDNQISGPSYSYSFRTQRVRLIEFVSLFGLDAASETHQGLIDELNDQLKNVAIRIYNNDNATIVKEYPSRRSVNAYFDERRYILDKRSETFPFSLPDHGHDERAVFRMYNVGQGDMSALFFGESEVPEMIFDLGCSRKCKSAIRLLSEQLLSKSNCTTVVISHFDNDHINMAKYLPSGGANLRFFMPAFLRSSDIYKPNIQLLLYKALINGDRHWNNICFFLNNHLKSPVSVSYATFYQGSSSKRDRNQSTDENSHCLVVYLNVNDKRILVPGDILYDDFFTKVQDPFKPHYVIVPHHSCNYKDPINISIIDFSNLSEAFVFCGPHWRYHHPNLTHFGQYQKEGAHIVRLARKKGASVRVFNDNTPIQDSYFVVSDNDYYDWVL